MCVYQAYTCGVPGMVKNVRQTEKERNGHHCHFLGIWLSRRGALARKKGLLCMREDKLSYAGKDWCTVATPGEEIKISLQGCADHSSHALQAYQHPVLALSPDGSGLIDRHARPCRPRLEPCA